MAGDGGIESLAALRLVSKSWCAAVEQSPRRVMCCNANQANSLQALCAIFPNMVHLRIDSACATTNLDVLATLRCLRSITLSPNWENLASQPSFKVSSLPAALRDMRSDGVRISPEQLDKANLPHPTRLHFEWEQTEEATSTWTLCSRLPHMKVNLA